MNLKNLLRRLLNLRNPKNRHYQRWTFDEIWDITNSNRANDEVLSKKLGRTVRAIREKRRVEIE